MRSFVLDNSVTMRWLMETNKKEDQQYAEKVLESIAQNNVLVPNLWHLEVTNVLLNALRREQILPSQCTIFLTHLEQLPIITDQLTANRAFSRTFDYAQLYKLSSYDAAYLELAIREGLPLASLDKDLLKAADKLGVKRYLIDDLETIQL